MLARRSLLALTLLAACHRGPPAWAPAPAENGAGGDGCARAASLRARAPGLVGEGRLDRAVRVLQRAEDLCPAEAPATWGPRVGALAALGRAAEALQLAGRIERSDRATDEGRAAARAARALAEEHARTITAAGSRRDDPELFDPAEKRRAAAADLHRRGARALRAGRAAEARELFLSAWQTSHPSPRALVDAGLAAAAMGDRAEAQRLWDRAAYDDAAVALRPEVPGLAPRAVGAAALAFSRDGARLAVGGDEEIAVHDGALAPLLRLRPGEGVTALAFVDGDTVLAAGLSGGRVRLYDGLLGAALGELRGHQGAVRVLAASPDGRTLATAADDPTVRLWDAVQGSAGRLFAAPRSATAIAWSADGARLAWGDDAGKLTLAESATGAVKALGRARGAVRALAFDGDALFVVTATERQRLDLLRSSAPPRTVARGPADLAAFPEAGGDVAAVQGGGALAAVPFASGRAAFAVPEPRGRRALVLAVSPDRRAVAALYPDRTLALLPACEGCPRRELGPASPLAAFAVAPTGKLFAGAGEDGRVLLWSVAPAGLSAFDATTRALAFTPDGRVLAVGGEGRVALRDVGAGQPGPAFEVPGRVDALAFSPDGLRLAAATSAPSLQIFAPGAGAAAVDSVRLEGSARAARFSPDGAAVLVAAKEGVVRWAPATHEALRFVPFGAEPRDAAFTPDGAGVVVVDKRGILLFGKPTEAAPAPADARGVASQALSLAVAGNGLIATAEGDRAIGLRGPDGKVMLRFKAEEAARAVAFLPQGVLASSGADGRIRLFRPPVVEAVASLRPAPGLPAGALAGVVESPSGHLDVVGPAADEARAALRCRIGPSSYPFVVCAERYATAGLLSMVLAGQDPAEAEP